MKPQDIVVALTLLEYPSFTNAQLAAFLSMSPSQTHASQKRLERSGLLRARVLNRQGLINFLVYGLRYVYPAERGGPTIGMPTAWAGPGFETLIDGGETPVWPNGNANTRGYTHTPLHYSAPTAALQSERIYRLLSAVETLRAGGARIREIAKSILNHELQG